MGKQCATAVHRKFFTFTAIRWAYMATISDKKCIIPKIHRMTMADMLRTIEMNYMVLMLPNRVDSPEKSIQPNGHC